MNQQFLFCYFLSRWFVRATNHFIEPDSIGLCQFHRKQNPIEPDCQITFLTRIQSVVSPCQDLKNIRWKLTRRVPEPVSPVLQCNDDNRRVVKLTLALLSFLNMSLWVFGLNRTQLPELAAFEMPYHHGDCFALQQLCAKPERRPCSIFHAH